MSDLSARLALPYLMPSQAQKHVTHNEALSVLDLVTQLSVLSRTTTTPPAQVEDGDRFIVPNGATGDWAGADTQIAHYDQSTWQFLAPKTGWRAYDQQMATVVAFDGTDWAPLAADQLAQFGVNAQADAVNRLTVSSDAVLLNHAGNGHQVKVNKASDTDTASLLFQTGFSGRAEMGTAGNDDSRG